MRYALLSSDLVVENVAVFGEAPDDPAWVRSDLADIGDSYIEGEFLSPAPPAMPVVVPVSVSDRQFFQGLAIRGEITETEALDAVGPGIIPAAMLLLIGTLPDENRFGASMLIRGATIFERAHPLAIIIGQLYGWDDLALDEFWTFAATL